MKKMRTNCLLFTNFIGLFIILITSSVHAAGPFSNASVGNIVWRDTDGNGIQDAGEPGYQGAQVILFDAAGNTIATTITDGNGNYTFSNVEVGASGKTFSIWFKLPSGYRFSISNGTATESNNSDAHPGTGKTNPFVLLPGQSLMDIDAGIVNLVSGILPLHRLLLRTTVSGSTAHIEFEAENEMNTARFVVERSFDGNNFSEIATVAVSGPLNTPTEYNLTDNIQPYLSTPVIYYRIKAEDNFSRAAYSNVALVRLTKVSGIRMWPNPFTDEIRISYTGSANTTLEAQLSDLSGRVAWNGTFKAGAGPNQFIIGEAGRLPAGIYYVRIVDKNTGQSFAERVMK